SSGVLLNKGKYELKKSSNNQFYFVLKATNGQVIATSEMYTTKQNAINGIESVKANANSQTVDLT
ncbi:YegP family protein, partial [Vibrio cholerae]